MLTIEAPAKINLTLEVLGKRPDGYHEIRSVIQTINFCDSLQLAPSKDIQFKSNMSGWSGEQSLVVKAIELLQASTGYTHGATIKIKKRLPLISGLGGDSSDAAAALRGLNELWGMGLSASRLLELSPRLGSDVAFFLHGGTALVEGRGEVVTRLPPLPRLRDQLRIPSPSCCAIFQ